LMDRRGDGRMDRQTDVPEVKRGKKHDGNEGKATELSSVLEGAQRGLLLQRKQQ
jgi:hypothetical protein